MAKIVSGLIPPIPALIVGRELDIKELRLRLLTASHSNNGAKMQVLTAMRGLPGVGKTTVAAALAHDSEVQAAFPDGILWTSLGQEPDLLSQLAIWGRALGTESLMKCRSIHEATARLSGLLRNKRVLLLVDDVWEITHVLPFRVGGPNCAMLVTTRVTQLAKAIAPTERDVYLLDVLSDDKALELLAFLAPSVVERYCDLSKELVKELEGLPLAIQVAGRFLSAETGRGFNVKELLKDLRVGSKILEMQAPADRTDLVKATIPTVAVLLQMSTNRLDPKTRERFAFLAAFAPKPATFDALALKSIWNDDDPTSTIRTLVDRGLLEYIECQNCYQLHSLLVLLARSLCSD